MSAINEVRRMLQRKLHSARNLGLIEDSSIAQYLARELLGSTWLAEHDRELREQIAKEIRDWGWVEPGAHLSSDEAAYHTAIQEAAEIVARGDHGE